MEKWFKKMVEPHKAVWQHSAEIIWYVHPHPGPAASRFIAGHLRRTMEGAAHTNNIFWNTRNTMEVNIRNGRWFRGKWYKASCNIRSDQDLFTLLIDCVIGDAGT